MGKRTHEDDRVLEALHRATAYFQWRGLPDPQVYGLVEDDVEYVYRVLVDEGLIRDNIYGGLPSMAHMKQALACWAVRQPPLAHEQPLDYPVGP